MSDSKQHDDVIVDAERDCDEGSEESSVLDRKKLEKKHNVSVRQLYRDFVALLNASPIPLFADAAVTPAYKFRNFVQWILEQFGDDDSEIEHDTDSDADKESFDDDDAGSDDAQEESEEEEDSECASCGEQECKCDDE